jgi:hypothetical protein
MPKHASATPRQVRYKHASDRHNIWLRVHRLLSNKKSRKALQSAMQRTTDAERKVAVRSAIELLEKRPVAKTSQVVSKAMIVFMTFMESVLLPELKWELRYSDEKGIAIHAKDDCEIKLSEIEAAFGKAELTILHDDEESQFAQQQAPNCCYFDHHRGVRCVLYGPICLLNRPDRNCDPHLVLCGLPPQSAQQRLIHKRVKFFAAEQQQSNSNSGDVDTNTTDTAADQKQQQQQQEKQQQQHRVSTRASTAAPMSVTDLQKAEHVIAANEAALSDNRKRRVEPRSIAPEDRLPPMISYKLGSSKRRAHNRIILKAGQELTLGYGPAYHG